MCAVGIVCVVDWLEPVHFMGCVQGHLVSVVLVFCFAAAGGCCAYFAHVHVLLFSFLLLQQFGFKSLPLFKLQTNQSPLGWLQSLQLLLYGLLII